MRPDEDTEDVLRRALRDLRECGRLLAEMTPYHRRHWEKMAGVELTASMLASRDSTERCLDHRDLDVRRVALRILVGHWRVRGADLRSEAVERLWRELAGPTVVESMLGASDAAKAHLADPDLKVREAAVSILTDYWNVPVDPVDLERLFRD